ncbi:MAG: protein-L-isoaspartate(D-aspartate) O-methyltransferase [Candidatus Aminicenantes bacterium]|nr:protein-L-isoaspartate(D-aspartate) O-methyltransferase [Candidatus Aminicenantes bacterium]
MNRDFEKERRAMVDSQIRARGVRGEAVLAALAKVPRHLFIPEDLRRFAYADEPLPIGEGQTISQPYIVAYMTEALKLRGTEKVLEVGTGSGYQTAVLAELSREVLTIEVVGSLAARGQEVLDRLGYRNIRSCVGDGWLGWPEEAPFDAVMVTAAASEIPPALEQQLAPGGRLIIPVGVEFQELCLVTRTRKGLERERLLPVRFVPLIRAH